MSLIEKTIAQNGSVAVNGDGNTVNNINIDKIVLNTMQRSHDYQVLQAGINKARQRMLDKPNVPEFREDHQALLKQAEDFKRDVLKLAEDFNKIPINTERLRLAKQHFEAGDYQAARVILDAEAMSGDQDALLAKQQRLNTEQAEVTQQLTDNAAEFLLKARLTAIDYSLPDRIAQTRHFFEQALKSARTPDNMFAYALFLQENNQFKDAEHWYQAALDNYRQLAEDNPSVYLPDVATILNNLGVLIKVDTQRRTETEILFKEALAIRRQLVEDNPAVYLPNVANTLNNLGNLVSADSQRRAEAETLYQEALAIRRQLAEDNPAVYLPDVAMTLNNLGILVSLDSQHRAEAEILFKEALSNYRQLAEDNPAVYLPNVATTLNNLGNLVRTDTQRKAQAEILYQAALAIRRQLAKDNPAVYLPDVAMTLNNLGILVGADSQRRAEAETLYQEALDSYCQLAEDYFAVYFPDVVHILVNLGIASLKDWQEPQQALIYLQGASTLLELFAQQAPELFAKKHTTLLKLIALAKQP
jgi:tetratricopeptide (TPR) repeat protein